MKRAALDPEATRRWLDDQILRAEIEIRYTEQELARHRENLISLQRRRAAVVSK